jgi:uncharacterized protein (TIGR03066 family)
MRSTYGLVAVLMLAAVSPTTAQDKGTLAGGMEWTVVKSEEAPPGTKILFEKDGKLVMTFEVDGKPRKINGSYTLAGNQLTLKLALESGERVQTRTVKKLTDSVLITEDKNKKVEELHVKR